MSTITDTPPYKATIHQPDHDDDLLSSSDDELDLPASATPPTDHGRQFYLPSHQSNCTSTLLANKWMLFAGLLCCVILYLLLKPATDPTQQHAMQLLNSADSGGATSGKEVILFRQRASPLYHLPSSVRAEPFPALSELIAGKTAPGLSTLLKCVESTARMAVMTSISPNPTAAEVGMALLTERWCTIVIGDKKGPNYAAFTSAEMVRVGVEQYLAKMAESKQTDTPATADKIDSAQLLARIAYIDVDEQALLPYELSGLTPYGSFSRKNLGFLLAFHSGASVVFDVDDDNIYLPNTAKSGNADLPIDTAPLHYASSEQLDHRVNSKVYREDSSDSMPDKESPSAGRLFAEPDKKTQLDGDVPVSVFNPYPLYGAEDTWPRGFPLNWVKPTLKADMKAYDGKCVEKSRYCSAVVQQMLANHDPDVDAIYRLTNQRGMPFDFLQPETGKPMDAAVGRAAPTVALPLVTYTPFNAQATIIMPGAFFAMLLPYTVHGRVADIWRSYIMETLVSYYTLDATSADYAKSIKHDAKAAASTSPASAEPCITFTAPHIYHDRNSHNYQLDFNSELPLYMQAESLVSWLSTRQLDGKHCLLKRLRDAGGDPNGAAEAVMADVMALLYVDLYEAGVVEREEVAYVQAWLKDYARIQVKRKELKQVPPPTASKADEKTCWPKYAA